MPQLEHNGLVPFRKFVVQLGEVKVFGCSSPTYYGSGPSRYTWFDNIPEAIEELRRVWTINLNSFKRECNGKDSARIVLGLIRDYDRNPIYIEDTEGEE